jgi:ferrous iron transport protein A
MHVLSELQPGQQATIQAISVDTSLFHRLSALGFRIGKNIQLIRRASFNGPLHVRIGTTDVMLRCSEAQHIQIRL